MSMVRASDQDTQRSFTRRALFLGGAKLVLLGVLGVRMHYLQVVEADRYRTLSENNQFNLELLPPVRGRILDRTGLAIAENEDNFRIEIVAEQTPDLTATLQALRSVVTIEDRDVRRVLKEARRKRGFVPITVVENLRREDIARVAVNAPYLPGVRIEVGRSRTYPFASDAVHVTGYVAAVSDSELTGDPILELPDFRIGKSGIERIYDKQMRGTAGRRQVEVNALGRIIRKLPGEEGEPGADIQLTIDLSLQRFATRRLAQGVAREVSLDDPALIKAMARMEPYERDDLHRQGFAYLNKKSRIVPGESGGVVLMDVHGGEVLALASTPGYDPNGFNKGLSARDWEELLSNPRSPLANKAVGGQYPPGSTFKMVVCLAALESGLVEAHQREFCPGYLELGNARFHCWNRHGHGHVNMAQGVEQSCDVYFYELAKRVGIDRIQQMARRFGFGSETGIELPGERRGLMPSREWKLATRGERWQKGESLITAIGQGFVLATPLQLATMTARMVNGGLAVNPHLVRRDPAIEQAPLASLNIKPDNLEIVMDAMSSVVNGVRGTARGVRVDQSGLRIAGKTGTAQVRRITRAERLKGVTKNKDLPWRERDHALFVGYAPVSAPRFAVAVVVEHGSSASKMAAPIARDLLQEALRLDPGGANSSAVPVPPRPKVERS